MIHTISTQEFSTVIKNSNDVFILDVRTDLECRSEKLQKNCVYIPLHELKAQDFKDNHLLDLGLKPIYILCRSGARALKAAQELSSQIQNDIFVIDGGIEGCKMCNIPTQKTNIISLERQVRITAGIFIVIGFFGGLFLNPLFYGLCAFVGTGLIFAGVTDKCGMALILTKAPWNIPKNPMEDIQKSIKTFEERKTA